MSDSNSQYRNSLFCTYFNEPVRLLSLCNAVLDTDYSDPNELKITTLDGIFFDERKNDISCKIHDNFLVLIEHQSSVNDNMPFRCLSYVTDLLNKLIEDKRVLYRKKLIRFPSPKFFVLYDGDDNEPLVKTLCLSDAFNDSHPALELTVTILNINYNLHPPILKKCRYLNNYSTLVGKVKEGLGTNLSRRDAILQAIRYCLDNNIMKDYLEIHSKEVFSMLTMEWDINEARQAWREDGLEEGRAEGRAEGRDEKAEIIAVKMLSKGFSPEEIHDMTELPIERIKQLSTSD